MRILSPNQRHSLIAMAFLILCAPFVLSQGGDFQRLAQQAAAARDGGRPAEAIDYYQRAVALRPDWDEGLWYLGSLNYDTDHYAEAIPVFKKLVERQPNTGPVWNLLGLSEFETRDYKNALPHLQRGLELGFDENPSAVKVARYHVALLLNLNGEFEQSTNLITATFGPGPLPEQIKVALGLALLRVPLLPDQVDPSKDALVHLASETAALLVGKNFDQALQSFQQLRTDYPDTAFLHYAYGTALTSASRYDQAATELREQVRLTPQFAPAHEVLSRALQGQGKSAEASKELELAKKNDSNGIDVNWQQAKTYGRENAVRPDQQGKSPTGSGGDFNAVSSKALADWQAGKTVDAIREYQAALTIRPAWDEGWSMLGTIYYSTGRCAEAIPPFKESVGINPKRSEAWAILGLCEFQTKDYKNSLIHLQNANDLGFAGNAGAVRVAKCHIAFLLNMKGQFDEATNLLIPEAGPGPFAEQINLALGLALLRMPILPDQIQPAQQSLVAGAGRAAGFLAQSKYDDAFPIFQQLLNDAPKTPYLHYAYGTALSSNSQYPEAKAQLLEETHISPTSALPFLRMASMALLLHAPDEALPAAKRAAELAPQSAEGHYWMGRAFLDLKQYEEAVRELETASRLAPSSPEVHFNLAKAYTKAKRPEDAERERETFTRLNELVEQEKSKHGSQTYAGSHGQTGLTPVQNPEQKKSTPE